MEGERRKRKLEKEEESEEQQMEKFFALIKSTKDARHRMSTEKKEEKAKGVWNPKFQLEDFVDDEELARIDILRPPAAGPSGKERKEAAVDKESPEATAAAPLAEDEYQKKAESDSLDLTLSL